MRMRTRSQSRCLEGAGRLPAPGMQFEGMMTRARRRRLGLPEPLARSGQSGRPRKPPRRRLSDPPRHPCCREWSNWADLTTVLAEDIAGRLLSVDVADYIRFRAVCKPWRDLTDDPRAGDGLDSRFRARRWFPQRRRKATPWHRRFRNNVTGVRMGFDDLQLFSTTHLLSVVDGLIVLCDKATHAVRLLNALTGAVAEYPDITDVRPHAGAEPSSRLAMDRFKARFPGGPESI
uniref:Uncharacterized protein n=1 Tax=Avena sativa TaxID=4498 RepID=A0ACD5ULZ4_AVESA